MKRRRQGAGSLTLRGSKWRLQYCVGGKPVQENSGTSDRKIAEELLRRRLAETQLGSLDGISAEEVTIDQLAALVIADQKLRGLRDWKTVEWRYRKNTAPELGKLKARRAKTAHFRAYIEKRLGEGARNASINRELATIRRGYKLGMKEEPPLVYRMPSIPDLDESDNVRQGFLEPGQYERQLYELPENLKALFVCGYNLGTRLNEIRRLLWTEVDLDAGILTLPPGRAKNKKGRRVWFMGDMEVYLRRQRERCPQDHPYVFFGERGRPVSKHLNGWKEACERAGLGGLHFHDLRRTAVRDMKRAGVADSVAKKISGHETDSMFRRYDIINEADMVDAAQQVDDYRKRKRIEAKKHAELGLKLVQPS
ncbi:MAG TPA: site-specific integrase [Terriglobales bacterium]|nr:site-specific integrase [Terriglobales bacterium]